MYDTKHTQTKRFLLITVPVRWVTGYKFMYIYNDLIKNECTVLA